MDEKIKIKVVLGSTREKRFGEKPAKWIHEEIQKLDGVEAELLDLRDYPMPFFNDSITPGAAKGKYSNVTAEEFAKKIAEGDAFIIVTPEYNHGYPAVLKNALDYIYYEWNKKPIGFVSYGGVGGARSVEQLRQVAVELQMAPIRSAVHISAFWTLVDEKGNLKTDTLEEKAKNMLSQLLWWARALKAARERDQ